MLVIAASFIQQVDQQMRSKLVTGFIPIIGTKDWRPKPLALCATTRFGI
jgi:hypothetical protein